MALKEQEECLKRFEEMSRRLQGGGTIEGDVTICKEVLGELLDVCIEEQKRSIAINRGG